MVNFGDLNMETILVEVQEGDITGVDIIFQDSLGDKSHGMTNTKLIKRELPKEVQLSPA